MTSTSTTPALQVDLGEAGRRAIEEAASVGGVGPKDGAAKSGDRFEASIFISHFILLYINIII